MRYARYAPGLGMLMASLLLLAGCSGGTEEQPISITVAASDFIGSAPVFIAQEEGFFQEAGLDVSLIINRAGVESLRNLFHGEADIAMVAELPLVYSAIDPGRYTDTGANPGEFRILADMFLSNNLSRILVRRDHSISAPEDLRNATIAAQRGTSIDFLLDLFLLTNGIDQSEVTVLDLDLEQQQEAILHGKVDAVFSWQPHVGAMKEELGEAGLMLPNRVFAHNAWLAVAMKDLLQEKPDTADRFLTALLRAEGRITSDPERAIAIYSQYTGTSRDAVARAWSDVTFWISLSEGLLTTMDDEARWVLRSGAEAGEEIPNFYTYLEFGPLERVRPEGITVIR